MQPTLYMMLGYPGAGKTTTAQAIAELTGAIHLSSDRFRLAMYPKPTFTPQEHAAIYGALDYLAEELLGAGVSIIYDANLNRFQHRQDKYDICERVGANPVLLWVQAPRDLAKERAIHDSRQRLWTPDETPDVMFDRIADIIEEPKPDEPVKVVDGTKVSPEYIAQVLGVNANSA